MGRISRAKPAIQARSERDPVGGNDGRGAGVRSGLRGIGAVADWSADGEPVSPSLAAARARYAAANMGRDSKPYSVRRFAVRLARLSGLRLEDVRQLTIPDALAIVEDLRDGQG